MSKKVAVLVEENVHDLEFWYPFYRIAEAGFEPPPDWEATPVP